MKIVINESQYKLFEMQYHPNKQILNEALSALDNVKRSIYIKFKSGTSKEELKNLVYKLRFDNEDDRVAALEYIENIEQQTQTKTSDTTNNSGTVNQDNKPISASNKNYKKLDIPTNSDITTAAMAVHNAAFSVCFDANGNLTNDYTPKDALCAQGTYILAYTLRYGFIIPNHWACLHAGGNAWNGSFITSLTRIDYKVEPKSITTTRGRSALLAKIYEYSKPGNVLIYYPVNDRDKFFGPIVDGKNHGHAQFCYKAPDKFDCDRKDNYGNVLVYGDMYFDEKKGGCKKWRFIALTYKGEIPEYIKNHL